MKELLTSTQALNCLKDSEIARVAKIIFPDLIHSANDKEVPAVIVMVGMLYQLMTKRLELAATDVLLILSTYRQDIINFIKQFCEKPVFGVIEICDKKFARFSGRTDILNLTDGKFLATESIKDHLLQSVISTSISLTALAIAIVESENATDSHTEQSQSTTTVP